MTRLLLRLRQIQEIARHLRYERIALRELPMAGVASDQADAAEAVRWLGGVAVAGEAKHALYCHPASSVSYTLRVQPGDRIAAHCALLPDVWDRNSGGIEFSVAIEAPGVSRERSTVVNPRRREDDRRWRSLALAVPVPAPQEVTLTLATRVPEGADSSYAWGIWGDPALERRRPDRPAARLAGDLAGRVLREGLEGAFRNLYAATRLDAAKARYEEWFARHTPAAETLPRLAADADRLPLRPLVSIVTPAYNTPPDLLRACVASVLAQTYRHWEWCLCNDASTSAATIAVFREQTDPRIRIIDLETNAGIAGASQAALEAATGEFIALLDSDDELTPDALQAMVARLNQAPDADVIYSDEDKRDEDGRLSEPFFKPDWSPEHLLSAMYTCHLTLARRSLALRAGGFRRRCEGSQDHDLMLRMSDAAARIEHVPRILYHWRRAPMSGAAKAGSKPWAEDAGRLAVADHLERHGLGSEVVSGGVPGLYRPKFPIRGDPGVLVLVLGDDRDATEACAARIRSTTGDARCDVAVTLPVSIEINALVAQAQADHVAFVDAAFDVVDAGWLGALLELSQQAAIGAVGGKVQYPDGRLRHIGLLLGVGGGVARAMHQHPGASYGYFSSAIGLRNYSAVSGEFFMTRRDLVARLGGFDESLPWAGADVDYCLKARAAGLRVVFTPYAAARIRPGASPGPALPDAATTATLQSRWPASFARDPYYNPNLSRASGDYALSFLPCPS